MGNTCFRTQIRLTEEEYCLYIKGNNILYVTNGLIENNIIFDKCDKTLGTVDISVVNFNISQQKISLISKVPNKEERVIKSFFYNPPTNNNDTMLSKGIINKCHYYEILYKPNSLYTNTKLKLQFPLTKEIKALFPKYHKKGDKVSVKLLVDECSEGYDADLSMKNCYVSLEVDVFSNIEKLAKARNIKVVKDNKCNKDILACFSIFEHNSGRYGVKLSVCDYCYTFTGVLILQGVG
jgi:hypothetical protein